MNTRGSPKMDAGGTARKKNGKLRIRWSNPDIFVTANHHESGETTQRIARVAGAGFLRGCAHEGRLSPSCVPLARPLRKLSGACYAG